MAALVANETEMMIQSDPFIIPQKDITAQSYDRAKNTGKE